ncbi:MAG: PaRep2b protein, partial [Pyrobaculum sp.]
YEGAREVFEQVKVTVQRLVEHFVEAVTRVLAWVDEHKAYLFLMAAGVIVLSAALDMWGLVELEKLAYAASAPFFAGLADAGERAAERFKALGERYTKWKVDENAIDGVLKAPLRGERPYKAFLKLAESANLPPPLVELRKALTSVEGEAEKDAAVVAALVLYKALVKNAGVYKGWARWYERARGLVKEREFTVKAEEVKRLREAHRRLEEAAEEVRRELNAVLTLYASHSRGLYEKLRPLLEVDVKKAVGLAVARSGELSKYSDANMGTKAYAALLSAARGGMYGHAATLLMGEGSLADIVLLTPWSAYDKAKDIAKRRGEAVDPSRSPKGAAGWEDRATSVLLRYLLGRAVSEDLVFRRIKGGFEVFRTYGGVEARVDVLKIEETVARSKAGEGELRRFVEEAKRAAPDLSGVKKIWHALEWFDTDASFTGGWIVAGTANTQQAAWYIALFGEPESISGGASITEEGIKLYVLMRWRRERLDDIIAEEGEELKPLLGRAVNSWRELVDVIDWCWVLERVRELADALKPWIGPESAYNAEREDLVRRMLGELALFVHFIEAKRGKNNNKWHEERVLMLSRTVEALSGGRITGEYAERLAKLVIRYAEGRKKETERGIENLVKELAGVSREEVWSVVKRVLSGEDPYTYCLARDCADDRIVRKFVAPALELVMLDKALRGELDRERVKLRFGEMYATAVAGDGSVGPGEVELAVGGELGGGAALLRLAALHLLNRLLPDELKFGVQVYVGEGRCYNITATSENATRLMRLLAVTAPSAGGKYLSDKFNEFVKEARVEMRVDNIRLTESGYVAADLTISEACVTVKYNVYLLKHDIRLQFQSTDRCRAELAALLLRHAGVGAEVKKKKDRNVWQVWATTDMLAAGREELRDAVRKAVEETLEKGWVDEEKARRWLEKLEGGVATWEGKKFKTRLVKGALEVSFSSADRESLEEVAGEFKAMGLEEGVHFTVRWSRERGRVYLLAEGVRRLAWVSIHGKEGQRQRAAEFLKFLEEKARAKGGEVLRKLEALVEEGRSRGALRLVGLERGGVKVLDVKAEERDDKLYVTIKAEVDGAAGEYRLAFARQKDGSRYLHFYVRGEEAVTRAVKLIEVLTGERPSVTKMPNGWTMIRGSGRHINVLAWYEELREAIERWSNR